MDRSFDEWIELAGKTLDAAGVLAILLGVLIASAIFADRLRHREPAQDAYRSYRQGLGRAILLGLELLVAADIVRTVAVSPTFESAGVLAIIVLIRTFLSIALQVELEGRFPWQRGATSSPPGSSPARP